MYQEYFEVPEPPIKVGARRFPVEEVFLEDITRHKALSVKERKQAEKLLTDCKEMKCKRPPSMAYMEKLYSVVASLATVVGKPGTSVLIFVPGMNDSKYGNTAISQFFRTFLKSILIVSFHLDY